VGRAFSQLITTVQAPQYDGSNSSLSVASGSADAVYHRSCWLILQSELTGLALTNSVITGMSLDYTQGTNLATSGNFTVWMANTGDASYSKGTAWSGIPSTMGAPHYQSTYSIPVTNGFTSVPVPFSSNFTYTGGGIYIALEWYGPTANATQWARAQCNTTGLTTTGGVRGTATSAGPAPTTLSTTAFRPAFTFSATNTATNQVGLSDLRYYGQITKLDGIGQLVSVQVNNKSAVTIPTIGVGMQVTGANSSVSTATVANLAAGASSIVTFAPYVSTAGGQNNIAVSILPDQDNSDNTMAGTQSVSCFVDGVTPAAPSASFAQLCYGGGGIVAMKFVTGTAPSSIVSVSGVAPSFTNAGNANNTLYAVLCDASGNIVAQGNPVTLTASNMDVFTAYKFNNLEPLTPNTTYYFGLASPTSTNYPFGTITAANTVYGHYRIPLTGGTPTQTDLEWLGLYATLTFTNTQLNITSTRTVVCKKESTVLTAVGTPTTWQWSVPGSPTTSTIVVTPTIGGVTGTGLVNYSVGGTDPVSGCKGPNASISVSISACTGLMDESAGANIRIFPNPTTSGKTKVTGLQGDNTLVVFNTIGQQVLSMSSSDETASIDLSNLPAGNYLVRITNSKNESKVIKLVN
jgi:hypothetical protein